PVEVAPAAAAQPAPANPFAEAELVNATKAPQPAAPKRRPSLFERMTRTGVAKTETAPEAPRAQPTLVMPQGGIMPTAAQPAAPAAIQPPLATPAPAPQTAQPRLGGLDPSDRLAPKAEDDLLEIPAFLRRQAN
ncbi:MAG: cell division protein FtsZ, partial [Tagaea sp.]